MSEVVRMEDSPQSAGDSILEDMQDLESIAKGTVQFDGIKWTLIFTPEVGYFWVDDNHKASDISRKVSIFTEIEALLSPYMLEFEDVTLAFSRILQEYEQMKRVTTPKEGISPTIQMSEGDVRPPARMGNYSDEEDEVQALLVEFARSVSRLPKNAENLLERLLTASGLKGDVYKRERSGASPD